MNIKMIQFANGKSYEGKFEREDDMVVGIATDMIQGNKKLHFVNPFHVIVPFVAVQILVVDTPISPSRN